MTGRLANTRAAIVTAICIALGVVGIQTFQAHAQSSGAQDPAVVVMVEPTRILDTRNGIGRGGSTAPGIDTFTLPVTRLAIITAIAAIAGALAATLPARRAGRLDVLDALAAN